MTLTTRRQLLATALAAPALSAQKRIGLNRISAITDEIGKTPGDSIAFARQYGLRWVELRGIPGNKVYYATMPEAELRPIAKEFAANGLKVSFLNTALLKFTLPGTEAVRRRQESEEARARRQANEVRLFERRMEDLEIAIRAAHAFDVAKIRVFTFSRVEAPETLFQRIVEVLGPMVKKAEKEGVQLLVENEASCNVASCAELASMMKMLPSKAFGINWDPLNGTSLKEVPFPDGYALLPKKRIGNVQIKARSILEGPQRLDWAAILQALEKDDYRGQVGLETHVFDGTLIEASHACMREIRRIVHAT
jgi:sugar phosphate isomerase/epimerase